jgi:hypothetical protein
MLMAIKGGHDKAVPNFRGFQEAEMGRLLDLVIWTVSGYLLVISTLGVLSL